MQIDEKDLAVVVGNHRPKLPPFDNVRAFAAGKEQEQEQEQEQRLQDEEQKQIGADVVVCPRQWQLALDLT